MRHQYTPAEIERFWSKVNTSGECWVWLGARSKNYGHFGIRGETVAAHRVAYEITSGPIPPGMYICHRCDNPPCVNPAHLFLGTRQDNIDDMVLKQRHQYGDRHWTRVHPDRRATGNRHGSQTHPESRQHGDRNPMSILTTTQVIEIRAALAGGAIGRNLAEQYGVSPATISRIRNGEAWRECP